MADEPPSRPSPPPNPTSCGCFAAVGFFLVLSIPVLLLAGLINAPCEEGPCHPEARLSVAAVAALLLALAALLGLVVRALIQSRQNRAGNQPPERERGPVWAPVAVALAAFAAVVALVFMIP